MIRIFTSKAQKIGERGEEEALVYLRAQGFRIIGRNEANKFGEIDIIAQKEGVTYFYEVKAGHSASGINPAENLTASKIRKFLVSVQHYCLLHEVGEYKVQGIIVRFPTSGDPGIEIIDL